MTFAMLPGVFLAAATIMLGAPGAAGAQSNRSESPWSFDGAMAAQHTRWQATTAKTREVKINATLALLTRIDQNECARCGPDGTPATFPGCAYVVVAQVSPRAGAVSYKVLLSDNGKTVPLTGPPFSTSNDYNIPQPATSWGLTAGNGPPPCPSEPTLNGRFKILGATATLDDKPRIVGTVRKTDGTGIAGVKVSARGPTSASATTGGDGSYTMNVKKGRYTVSARGHCLAGSRPCKESKTVTVGAGAHQVDFFRELTLSVSGTVRDEFRRGLGGVRTSLTGPETARATTDAGGRYRLEVGKPGSYALAVTGTGRGPNERYYIVQDGRGSLQMAASVALTEQTDSVKLDWELDRRLQFSLATHDPARADGFSRAVATLRALTQRGDPAPGVVLNVDPASEPRAVICSTGEGSRPLWPSVLSDGTVSAAGIPRGPDTTTNQNGELSFRVFPGSQAGTFRISGSRPPVDSPGFSSFSLTIPFVGTGSRPLNGASLARALVEGGIGVGIFGSPGVLFEALAGRQLDTANGLSGMDGVPVVTSAGRKGIAFYSRGAVPLHSERSPRVIGITDSVVVLGNELLARVNPASVLPTLREWAKGEFVAADTTDPRTYLGWPVPTTANGGLGTCLVNALPDRFVLGAHSPVRILLTDSKGRKLGTDAVGRRFNTAPGALYRVGQDAFIVAPPGSYRLSLVGTGSGPVTLETRRGRSTTVARFLARRGARTTLRVTNGALPRTFTFAGRRVRSSAGMPLVVRGIPRVLQVRRSRRVNLLVTDGLGNTVPAAVKVTGPAGTFTRFANDRGRLALTLRPARRGTVRFTFSAADLLPATAQARAVG